MLPIELSTKNKKTGSTTRCPPPRLLHVVLAWPSAQSGEGLHDADPPDRGSAAVGQHRSRSLRGRVGGMLHGEPARGGVRPPLPPDEVNNACEREFINSRLELSFPPTIPWNSLPSWNVRGCNVSWVFCIFLVVFVILYFLEFWNFLRFFSTVVVFFYFFCRSSVLFRFVFCFFWGGGLRGQSHALESI